MMHRFIPQRGIVPVLVASFVLSACAGKLVALEGETGGSAGAISTGGYFSPTDCGFAILTQQCAAAQDTFARCKSCSGFSACHGKDMPAIPGFDLTADGIGDGTQFIGKNADNSVAGSCGAMATPNPISGEVLIDARNPENSLIYQKVTASFGGCGSRMPFASTKFLSAADQQCILGWIKTVPGVSQNSVGASSEGGSP